MGKYDDDEGGYFCELLKEGLTERDMSGLERGWSIGVGLIGAVVADPFLCITRKLCFKGEPQDYYPGVPTHPFNQNY